MGLKAAVWGARATAMTFHGPQSCSLPACKGSKLPKFQTPSPTNTIPSRHLRSTAMTFYGPQSCRFQRIQTSKIPNTFPNMHPRAKATSPTGTPGPGHSNGFLRLSKLPFASPQTLQNSPKLSKPSKPSKRSKPSKTCQTLQTPSPRPPQIPMTFRHLRGPGPQQ